MPLTLNQLKAKMRQNPEKFREDQQKLMDFSKTLYKGALQNERIAARPLSMRFGGKRQMSVEKRLFCYSLGCGAICCLGGSGSGLAGSWGSGRSR